MKVQFGELIRKKRIEKNMNQNELAKLANLNRNYISDVERGTRNISLMNILKLFEVLSIEVKIK